MHRNSIRTEAACLILAEFIVENSRLKKIAFKDCILTKEGWKIVFDAMVQNISLIELSLDYQTQNFNVEYLWPTLSKNDIKNAHVQ